MSLVFDLYVRDFVEKCKKFDPFHSESALSEAVDVVLALVMIVVVGAIGIFIADKTVTATGTPAQANLSSMQTNILSAGQTGSSFIVILVIAFIGGIAIAYMFGLMGKRGRR